MMCLKLVFAYGQSCHLPLSKHVMSQRYVAVCLRGSSLLSTFIYYTHPKVKHSEACDCIEGEEAMHILRTRQVREM